MPAHSAYDLDRHMNSQLPPTNPPSPQVSENVQRAVECYVHNTNNANNHMSGAAPAFDICVSDDIRPGMQIPNPFEQHAERRSQNMTECVAVPSSEHVAEIVGRQGCKIKALRAKTNTYIKTPVRGDDPLFVVTGRKEDVYNAKREILSAAEHFSQIRACRKNNLNGSMAPGPPVNMPGQITKQVRVPYRVVGLVVGPKGATIKRIQQNTRTYIVTPSRDKDPVFEVTGLPDSVENAKKEIESHIALRTGGLNEGDDTMSAMNVASNLVSAVRGSFDNTLMEKNLMKMYTPSNSYNTDSYENLLNTFTNNLGSLTLNGTADLPVSTPSMTIGNVTNGNSYNLQSNAGQLFDSNKSFAQEFGLGRCKSPGNSGNDVVSGIVGEGLGSSNGSSPSFNTKKALSIWGDATSATSQRITAAMQATMMLGSQGGRGSTGSGPIPPTTRTSPGLSGLVDNDYRYSTSAFPFSFGNGFSSATRALSPDDMKFIAPDFASRLAPGCDRNSPTSPLEERLCRSCKKSGAVNARVPCGHDNNFCLACTEQLAMAKLMCPLCRDSLARHASEIKN